jgi:hypothetical protein
LHTLSLQAQSGGTLNRNSSATQVLPFFGTRILTLVVLAWVLTSCGHSDRGKELLGTATAAVTETKRFTIKLPTSVGVTQVALGANAVLQIDDRVQVVTTSGGFAPNTNAGNSTTNLGVDSKSGGITSVAPVVLRDRAQVTGNVTSAGNVTLSNGATISGQTLQNSAVPLQTLAFDVAFPTATTGITLQPDQSASAVPGAFTNMTLGSRSRLSLSAGNYTSDSLDIEPQATLALDTTTGPILLFVKNNIIFRGSLSITGPTDRFFLASASTASFAIESPFTGTLVAPDASVRMGVGSTPHRGSVFAKSIELDPDVRFTFAPFSAWDQITFAVVPEFDCFEQRQTSSIAVFGYVNPNARAVSVTVGADNQLTPGLQDRRQPTTFLAGKHANAFAVTWLSFEPMWHLQGFDVSVDRTRVCPSQLEFSSVADATVKKATPLANFGSTADLHASSDEYALVSFDKQSIRTALGVAGIVQSARLEVTLANTSNVSQLEILPMKVAWTESGATWSCANDTNPAATAEVCRALDAWQMNRRDGTLDNPWQGPLATKNTGTVQGTTVSFDVTRDLQRFLGGESHRFPAAWVIQSASPTATVLNARETGAATAPRLVIQAARITDFDIGSTPLSFVVDPTVSPSMPDFPAFSDGIPRPVAAVVDPSGNMAPFTVNELLVQTDDSAQLAAIRARWNAQEVATSTLSVLGAPGFHVLRIDPSRANPATIVPNIQTMVSAFTGQYRVSSDAALRLLAIATDEATRGTAVGVNWIPLGGSLTTQGLLIDKVVTDGTAMSFPVTPTPVPSSNDFLWPHFINAGVTNAWRELACAGKLSRTVKVAIIDAGFALKDVDLAPGTGTRLAFPPWACPGSQDCANPFPCHLDGASNSCPWHGTHTTNAGFGEPGNAYASAGPGGPVSNVTMYVGEGDPITVGLNLGTLLATGADIINFSNDVPIPGPLAATINIPGEVSTELARLTGKLVFAIAGNDGKNVDSQVCVSLRVPTSEIFPGIFSGDVTIAELCAEDTWHFPCENDGVHCVGGTNFADKERAPKSNFGTDGGEGSVTYYATGTILASKDPANQALGSMYTPKFGTSYSSPFAAGIAALTWAANRGQSAGQVEACLGASFSGGPQGRFITADTAVLCALGSPANLPPVVEITSPTDGAAFNPGSLVLRGVVGDCEDSTPPGLLTWSSDAEGGLGQSSSGGNLAYTPGSTGLRTITAKALDSQGAQGSASVRISIKPAPPDVRIVVPRNDGTTTFVGLPTGFVAAIAGTGLAATTLVDCTNCSWTGTQNGLDFIANLQGANIQPTFTSAGSGTVTASSSNAFGSGSATRRVTIISDGKVHVKITQPTPDSTTFAQVTDGQSITLSAVATTSNGQFTWLAGLTPPASGGKGGTAPTIVGGPSSLATVTWTPMLGLGNCEGPIEGTLTVQFVDSLGNTVSDTIGILVNSSFCLPT